MPYDSVASTQTMAGIAKEIYPIKEIKDMEQRVTAFRKEVEDDSELVFSPKDEGTFTFAVKASGAHGQKMMNERERLPRGKPSVVVQGEARIKEYAGVIEFTKRELTLAQKNAVAFANVKTLEMESLIENAHKYFNRQIANGDGSGTMTLVQGNEAIGQTTLSVDDATPFQIGMVIDQFDPTGATKQNADLVIVDIDILSTPNTIQIADALTAQADDNGILCIAGSRDNMSADGKEMIGMPLVTDDGTLNTSFQGIVRSGVGEVPNYRGISLDLLGAPLGVANIAQLMSRAFRIGGVNFAQMSDVYWLISPEQWRSYAAEAIPQIHFTSSEPLDMAKGYGSPKLEIAGKRAVLDTDVNRTSAYLIRKGSIKMGVAQALDWESDLGGTTLKWLSGYAQGIMLLYALQQFFSNAPRESARIMNAAVVPI